MHDLHNDIRNKVTGVLLAGGRSVRMGHDKALIRVAGQSLLMRSLMFLKLNFDAVLIAGDRPAMESPDIQTIPDIYPGSALGGLYTGLKSAATDWIFVMPCDMPYPDKRILELLFSLYKGADAIVPRTPDGYEPVFAFYHKRCLPVFEDALKRGKKSIFALYPQLNVRCLDWQDMPTDWEKSLLNINTPDDLLKIKEEIS